MAEQARTTEAGRRVYWGHSALCLYDDGRLVETIPFPTGPWGPCDGTVGSPERARFEAIAAAWREGGEAVRP